MARLGSTFVTAALLFTTTLAINTSPASGFVASDKSVTFALNIPQADDNNDLYFTLSGSSAASWIAVGMGSDKMDDSLIFMVYADSTGKNITLSPRLTDGHVEPTYTKDIEVYVQPGSGIANDIMTANVQCKHCRTWKDGRINENMTAAQFIFATGPDEDLKSNSLSANIKRHSKYGTFSMDLTKAFGTKGVPIAITADTSGTTQETDKTDHDFTPALHACVMILAFVGLMPVGVLILRILNSPKWHGMNQAVSAAVALIGAGLGVYIAPMYNRSKGFNSAHEIFGIVIIVALIGQFVLGFLHHRMYTKTQAPTKLSPVHVWLGRVVIPCGMANGFLGFPLALNSKYNWALLALILLVVIVVLPFLFWRYKRNSQKKKTAFGMDAGSTGYQSQPWTAAPSQSDINLNEMNVPPPYQNQGLNRQFA